jgi:hypothetical protein
LQRQVVTVLGSIPARCSCWVSQTIYRFNSGGCQLFFTAVNTGGFRHHPRPRNYILVLTAEVRPRHYIMVLTAEHQVREWFLVKAKLSHGAGCFDNLFHSIWMLQILLLQMLTCTILTRLTSDFRVKCSRASRVCLLTLPCTVSALQQISISIATIGSYVCDSCFGPKKRITLNSNSISLACPRTPARVRRAHRPRTPAWHPRASCRVAKFLDRTLRCAHASLAGCFYNSSTWGNPMLE